jgi:glycosyltransferase involved in cell wall biosynthesis
MLALLVWALAAYGFLVGLQKLFRYVYLRSSEERKITIVLVIYNAESYIEGLLRVISYKAFLSRKDVRSVVVDTGSEDSTLEIVTRLQKKDGRIELVQTALDFDVELVKHLWLDGETYSPYVLFDVRGWKNPRKIIPSLARIMG